MDSVIAMKIITTLVASSAAARPSSGIRLRNGGDGMNWSQNSTPARKNEACISQMCTSWLSCARSNAAGMCQATITRLNSSTATSGAVRNRHTARSGRDQPPAMHLPGHRPPGPPGQRVEQRLPRRARDDERRRGEHQQQVLHHVDHEVGVGPVVDRRHDGDQQHRSPL